MNFLKKLKNKKVEGNQDNEKGSGSSSPKNSGEETASQHTNRNLVEKKDEP